MMHENVRIPEILLRKADKLEEYYTNHYKPLAPLVKQCFLNTIETTVKRLEDGSIFVITGDIHAMWLRDSAAQVMHYVRFAGKDKQLQEIIEGVIARQAVLVCEDPYANAFNEKPDGSGHKDDTKQNPLVFERKYETDSLCAPVYLAYHYWKSTARNEIFTNSFYEMLQTIVNTFEKEQDHGRSEYYFRRDTDWEIDTLACDGVGRPVGITGMTWSGFRPSDDSCYYHYLIPANMMAAVAMDYAQEMLISSYHAQGLADRCVRIGEQIRSGITSYGVVEHPKYGSMYAYEVDGLGNHNLMDDANSPGLLGMPYLNYCDKSDVVYRNTREFILSKENPYYAVGSAAGGLGSPHTEKGSVWHIGIIMQALTSDDRDEIMECLEMLSRTHAGTNYMHESFDPDNPEKYTRSWFAWVNSLFAELMIRLMEERFFEGQDN